MHPSFLVAPKLPRSDTHPQANEMSQCSQNYSQGFGRLHYRWVQWPVRSFS